MTYGRRDENDLIRKNYRTTLVKKHLSMEITSYGADIVHDVKLFTRQLDNDDIFYLEGAL